MTEYMVNMFEINLPGTMKQFPLPVVLLHLKMYKVTVV